MTEQAKIEAIVKQVLAGMKGGNASEKSCGGKCNCGKGGEILLNKAREVIACEFPELDKRITLNIPDEKARRVGQSVAAASLPRIKK